MTIRLDAAPTRVDRTRSRVRWALIGAVGLGLLLLMRQLTDSAGFSLPGAAQDFVTLSASVVIESLPFVILGIVLSAVVQLWVPRGVVERMLPRTGALRRAAISVLGILLPVCECGNVPLARGFLQRGFTVPESITFLLAAPIVNPITILTTWQVFGGEGVVVLARILGALAIANLVGWLFSRHPAPQQLLTERFAAECRVDHSHAHSGSRWAQTIELFRRESSALMPALLIGSMIAGAVQVGVPRDVLVALGSDPIWSVLAMMLLAFVISICSNVDAFFVLPFASTFLPGSIVAFLVFGPMIDIKMLALLRTTFTARTLVLLTVIVALLVALLGGVVNLVG